MDDLLLLIRPEHSCLRRYAKTSEALSCPSVTRRSVTGRANQRNERHASTLSEVAANSQMKSGQSHNSRRQH